MRKICIITGTRANYGRLKPVLNAIIAHNDLELQLIVTGMHLSSTCGHTIDEIKADGYTIDYQVDMQLDETGSMAKSLGHAIIGITDAFETLQPDIILILGDRGEELAAAIAGAHMNIPVAHMHGGEVTGTIDESIRHAITKFAHIHFAATQNSYDRIKKLGENPDFIFNIGSCGLDTILNRSYLTKQTLFEKYNLTLHLPLILVLQHPVTTQKEQAAFQMSQTMQAVTAVNAQVIVIYPNSDSGSSQMIDVINKYKDDVHIYKNLPFEDYLNFLKHANVLVGNSSSAIMEAPSYGLPSIDIGIRQDGRECTCNVIKAGHDKTEILEKLTLCLYDKKLINSIKQCINPYGDGNTSRKAAEILAALNINHNLIQKQITY
ncbi:MAG: UDP-N-acetyl-D-glucosamine 2-epimerase, UDP-hydrolysing [Epulopiscium sp. Nuni2H_MBin001]|nr:MAG: UDP-N-acetyl-D-glucosamine 2-epimerase, UDP-hydrolysing [Epulopiscium sp. Nuni2H_MBin001]